MITVVRQKPKQNIVFLFVSLIVIGFVTYAMTTIWTQQNVGVTLQYTYFNYTITNVECGMYNHGVVYKSDFIIHNTSTLCFSVDDIFARRYNEDYFNSYSEHFCFSTSRTFQDCISVSNIIIATFFYSLIMFMLIFVIVMLLIQYKNGVLPQDVRRENNNIRRENNGEVVQNQNNLVYQTDAVEYKNDNNVQYDKGVLAHQDVNVRVYEQ